MANQTKEDAFALVAFAQIGSLANHPSQEYCLKLREQLLLWVERVDQQLYNLDMEEFAREEQQMIEEEERQESEFLLTHSQRE
jgi:hypothetical protein